jgi:phytoene dehydrogenase-like protein
VLAQHHVHQCTITIDCSIRVAPLPMDFEVCFIRIPARTFLPQRALRGVDGGRPGGAWARLCRTQGADRGSAIRQFARHWPELAERVAFHELATPLTQRRFVRTPGGSVYGRLQMSAGGLEAEALDVRTPIPGLLLAGQDGTGAGVHSGLHTAAAIRPSLLRHLTRYAASRAVASPRR